MIKQKEELHIKGISIDWDKISREECIRILNEQARGVLSVLGDDGYPYGLPLLR